MKRRKRTNERVPAKGRLREIADKLWSLAVRDDWVHKCATCGRITDDYRIEAHHIIPRQHQATRYELRNGIALCSQCHKFDPEISPHQNAAGWMEWLGIHHEELHEWVTGDPRPKFDGIVSPWYYCDVIRGLKQYFDDETYTKIVGVKFSQYLEEQE